MKKRPKRSQNKFANGREKTGGQKTFYVNYDLGDAFDAAAKEFEIPLSTYLNSIIHQELYRIGRLPPAVTLGEYNGEPLKLPPTSTALFERLKTEAANQIAGLFSLANRPA